MNLLVLSSSLVSYSSYISEYDHFLNGSQYLVIDNNLTVAIYATAGKIK